MKTLAIFTMLLVWMTGCQPTPPAPDVDILEDGHPKVELGMTKDMVLQLMGEPQHKREMIKSSRPGFGFPTWWNAELKNGDKVEAWDYTTPKGQDTIYFLNGSTHVGHTRFVKKGIVF